MFEKLKLRRAIRKSKNKIEHWEKKRYRSQAALVNAIMTKAAPDDTDVAYFNFYTGQIEKERAALHRTMTRLDAIK
ncbi:MAG: hypothetical protein J6X61_03970 [Clostridia bacterium]|nr:hypothetical protein [Clostridia bacterium]